MPGAPPHIFSVAANSPHSSAPVSNLLLSKAHWRKRHVLACAATAICSSPDERMTRVSISTTSMKMSTLSTAMFDA
jgi:hypothetical protein